MRVATRLWGGALVLLLLLGSLVLYHVATLEDLAEAQRRLAEGSARTAVTATAQLDWLEGMRESAAKLSVTGDSGYARRFDELAARARAAASALRDLDLAPAERGALAALLAEWEPVPAVADTAVGSRVDSLEARTLGLMAASRVAMQRQVEESAAAVDRATTGARLFGGLALLVGVLVIYVTVRSISRSIDRLGAAAQRVADGDFSHRMEGARGAEFRALQENFNVMIRRLGELDRLKRDFVSGISHDLKSPLASMQEAQNVLLEEVPGPLTDRQRRLLELSRKSGERLREMISKLLDLARLDAEALALTLEETDLAELVRSRAAELEPRLAERGVHLSLADLPDSLPVVCDRQRIGQVLDNLLENALRFTPADETVSVAGERLAPGESVLGAPAVVFQVRDRGPGVPDARKEAIFERFVQGNAGDGRGAGLGLTISRGIVTAHGGRIEVSDGPEGGAEFRVELPSEGPAAPPRAPGAPEAA